MGVGPGVPVGHLTDLFSWGRGYSHFTNTPFSLEIMKVIDEDESKGKLSEFDCFVFTFHFI